MLPAANGFPKKCKPLVRLTEREMAAYCLVRGIDYVVEECPMAAGNRHLRYKEALNAIERHVARFEGGRSTSNFLDEDVAVARRRIPPPHAGEVDDCATLRRADDGRCVRILPFGGEVEYT